MVEFIGTTLPDEATKRKARGNSTFTPKYVDVLNEVAQTPGVWAVIREVDGDPNDQANRRKAGQAVSNLRSGNYKTPDNKRFEYEWITDDGQLKVVARYIGPVTYNGDSS